MQRMTGAGRSTRNRNMRRILFGFALLAFLPLVGCASPLGGIISNSIGIGQNSRQRNAAGVTGNSLGLAGSITQLASGGSQGGQITGGALNAAGGVVGGAGVAGGAPQAAGNSGAGGLLGALGGGNAGGLLSALGGGNGGLLSALGGNNAPATPGTPAAAKQIELIPNIDRDIGREQLQAL
jgi:hypothetical protein